MTASVAPGRRGLPNHVVGMALLVTTELMFFAGLVSALVVSRANTTVWTLEGQPRLPVERTAFNTALLLLSGWTMIRAVGRRGSQGSPEWLARTALLGAGFVLLQGVEWVRLLRVGLTLTSSLTGAFFYLIVGAHALHAMAGVALVGAAGVWPRRRPLVEAAAIYWWFVVGLWPILYVLVYLG
ncbi:MAG TPA: cytochrome c oxidase subunit 3 [Gemmatimonadales bacterium]|nr:cytochrome c oxidase subunit 3 [Gemmatimonadales bacterium]